MFWEAWQYITTPCPIHLRKMGCLKELISIASRYRRLKKVWKPHLQQTQEFILSSAERCSQRHIAVILGSGWLLDIPWQALSRMFSKVYLVDLIHSRAVQKKVRTFPNIILVTKDVTGVIQPLFEMQHRFQKSKLEEILPEGPLFKFSPDNPVDYLVSANVLSQLSLLPLEFLKKHFFYSKEALQAFERSILSKHIEVLKKSNCPFCLVSDVESLTFDKEGLKIEQNDLLCGLHLPVPQSEWIWQLAPFGEIDAQHRTERRVVGING